MFHTFARVLSSFFHFREAVGRFSNPSPAEICHIKRYVHMIRR